MSDALGTISVYLEPTKRKLTLDLSTGATIGDVVQGMVTHLRSVEEFDVEHFLREKIGDGYSAEWQLFREGQNMQLLPPEARFSELQPPLALDEMFTLKVNAKVAAKPELPRHPNGLMVPVKAVPLEDDRKTHLQLNGRPGTLCLKPVLLGTLVVPDLDWTPPPFVEPDPRPLCENCLRGLKELRAQPRDSFSTNAAGPKIQMGLPGQLPAPDGQPLPDAPGYLFLAGGDIDSAAIMLSSMLTKRRIPFRFVVQRDAQGVIRDIGIVLTDATPEEVASVQQGIEQLDRFPRPLLEPEPGVFEDVTGKLVAAARRVLRVEPPAKRVPAPPAPPGTGRGAPSPRPVLSPVQPEIPEQENWTGYCESWRIEVRGSSPRSRRIEQDLLNFPGTARVFRQLREQARTALTLAVELQRRKPPVAAEDIRYSATVCAHEGVVIFTAWVPDAPNVRLASLTETIPRLMD